jgi:hypothetical protein
MKIRGVLYKKIWMWLIFFLIVGTLQWKLGFDNNKAMVGETDAFSRLLIIQEYIRNGGSVLSPLVKLPLGGVWLSGYFSLFIMFSKIGLNEVGFRIITWLCGLLLSLLVWLIANKLTKSYGGVWRMLILFVFILSPLMLQTNLEMLAEPIGSFLFLISLFFLLGGKNIWSIVFLFFSQSVRYEAWFMVPFYWIYLSVFPGNTSRKNKAIIFLGSLLFPLIWVILNFSQNGNAVNFYTTRQSYLNQSSISQYDSILIALSEWILRLQEYISVEWFMLWIFGIIWIAVWGSKKQKWWGCLSIYSFALVVLQLWLKSTEWFAPRFIYLVYVLSVPIVLMTVDVFVNLFKKTSIVGKLMMIFVFIWLTNQYVTGMPVVKNKVNAYFAPNQEIRILSDDLKREKYLNSDDMVIFLWLKNSPWLINDFNYYLVNRNEWKNIVEIKNDNDLMRMKGGDLLVAEKGLIEGRRGFSKLFYYNMFEVWLMD